MEFKKDINILNANKEEVTDAESLKQLGFIEEAKGYVEELKKELGRTPKACVVTFGCQMNAEPKTR